MKSINNYITEKLKISKDTVKDKYNKGDYCLTVSLYNWRSSRFTNNNLKNCVGLDLMRITDVQMDDNNIVDKISIKYLTGFHHTGEDIVTLENGCKESIYPVFPIQDFLIEVIIPTDEVLDVLTEIKETKTLNIIKKMNYCPEGFEKLNKEIPVSFEKKDLTKITFSKTLINDMIKDYEALK